MLDRGGPDRVSDERGDDRGRHAFALDVADRDHPVVRADLEHVVEVTADLVALTGRAGRRQRCRVPAPPARDAATGCPGECGRGSALWVFGCFGTFLRREQLTFVAATFSRVEHGDVDHRLGADRLDSGVHQHREVDCRRGERGRRRSHEPNPASPASVRSASRGRSGHQRSTDRRTVCQEPRHVLPEPVEQRLVDRDDDTVICGGEQPAGGTLVACLDGQLRHYRSTPTKSSIASIV